MKIRMVVLFTFLATACVQAEQAEVPRICDNVLYDYEQFVQVKKIGDILWEIIAKQHQEQVKKSEENFLFVDNGLTIWPGSAPSFYQTAQGFFLESYYKRPSSLWTPWGKVSLTGGCRVSHDFWEKVFEEFQTRVMVELHEPGSESMIGWFGPIYKVIAVDGVRLPNPVLRLEPQYETYEDVKKAWEILENCYNLSHNKACPKIKS